MDRCLNRLRGKIYKKERRIYLMRRLRYFLASVIALIALTFVFYSLTSVNPTGFAVASGNEVSLNAGFEIHDLKAVVRDGIANVEYFVREFSGSGGVFDVHYEVFDSDGNVYSSGNTVIVVNENSDERYDFSFKVPNDVAGSLLVRVSNSNGRSISSVPLNSPVNLTEKFPKIFGSFVFFLVILGILFYCTKAFFRRKEYRNISKEFHDSRFVKLNLK